MSDENLLQKAKVAGDPKEKQRVLSMINDYNAYKSSGGRLYEISVERDTETEFVCKGVLRLYWDIQRPIVLNKEATSSFVQKRERSSNIVGRPAARRREKANEPRTGISELVDNAFNQENITDISPVTKPRLMMHRRRSSESAPLTLELERCRQAKVDADIVPAARSGTRSGSSSSNSSRHGLHLPFEFVRSSSVGAPLRSNSFGGRDKKERQKIEVRVRTKSSLENAGDLKPRISKEPRASLRPTTSNGSVTANVNVLRKTAGASNFSRMLTSSFKRPKSPRTSVVGAPALTSTSSGSSGGQMVNSSHSVARLELTEAPCPPATTGSSPANALSSAAPTSSSAASAPQDAPPLSTVKLTKKRGTSFRKNFQRSASPKRRPSQSTDDIIEGEVQVKESPALAVTGDPPEKISARLGIFLSRPRISFKLRRTSPSQSTSIDMLPKDEPSPPLASASASGAESLAEFYQPPKGSVSNIRATSDMSVFDVIGATLNKLNAVDEPTRFAIFSIDDTGTVKMIQDDEWLLLYRMRLGPKEDVCKLFIMERNTSDAQDFSVEVMQYYHLGMPFLQRLILAYNDEEAREVDRVRLKFVDTRRRLEKRLETAAKERQDETAA